MGFGPTTIATLDTKDVQAPGAPGLTARQLTNDTGEFTFTPPTTDADGSPLTGLTYGQAVVIEADADEAEQYRNDFDSAVKANGAQLFDFDLADAEPVSQKFKIADPGKPYSVIARAADHPRGR